MTTLLLLLLLIVIAVAGRAMFLSFRAQAPGDYAGTSPEFSLKQHLSGPITTEGMIFGPTGRMTNTFVATMLGEWGEDSGTLSEHFVYSNGVEQRRKWYLKLGPGNSFTATADDIIGEAVGTVSGSTVMLRYTIVLPPEAGGYRLAATDWMYLTRDGGIMNKSELRKYGIKVAELIATMRPDPAFGQ